MSFGGKIAREQLIGLDVISSALFVEIVNIRSVDKFCFDIFIDYFIEFRHSDSANSVSAVDGSFDLLVPAKVVS